MTELALPTTGDHTAWTPQELALAEAAGLVKKQGNRLVPVPRPAVEAFLHHCRRTGLDPIARQIYLIERGGRHTIMVSIDGMRLIAERSGQYRGQTPVQWTGDGANWLDVWLDEKPPAAARVGVYREGFAQPVIAVANFDAYNAGGPMWKKMPALMIGKVAEMLALRKAFPQDLSGLYGTEEMDQADARPAASTGSAPAPQVEGPQSAPRAEVVVDAEAAATWLSRIDEAQSADDLRAIYNDAQAAGALNIGVPHPLAGQPGIPDLMPLGQYIPGLARQRAAAAAQQAQNGPGEEVAEPVEDEPDLVAQAQARLKSDEA